MVLIKSYRINSVGHSGAPYTMDLDFTEIQVGNQCHFDHEKGIPIGVAEGLVNGWNRTTKLYGKPTVYSIILPVQEMPVVSQSASTAKSDIEDATMDDAFDFIKSGQWSVQDFEEWCTIIRGDAHKEGYNDGISEAKAMIDSLLQE
jgi:hypothetical protein